ncbi:unnamed protein product [Owenia fusiformis]|uniref:Uncharacterized protein n=1 Tax=Owenia fusiformis TaxID=6347 RepID=A0A8J1UFN0_OWEFU|nr:unnamed protein product [Owenia fusiformis]
MMDMNNNNMMPIQQNTTQEFRSAMNIDTVEEGSSQRPQIAQGSTASSGRVDSAAESHTSDRDSPLVESETHSGEHQRLMSEEEQKRKERRNLVNFRHRDLTRRHRVLFDKLRVRLPVRPSCYVTKERTLDMALDYINYLESLLGINQPTQQQIAALAPPPGRRMDNGPRPLSTSGIPQTEPKHEETVESRPLCSMIPGAQRHGTGEFNQGFIDMSRQRGHSEVAPRRQLFNDSDQWSMGRPQSTSTPVSQAVFPGQSSMSPLATAIDNIITRLESGSSGYRSNSHGSVDSRRLDSQSSLPSTCDDDDVFEYRPNHMVWPERSVGSNQVEGFASYPPRHHSSL